MIDSLQSEILAANRALAEVGSSLNGNSSSNLTNSSLNTGCTNGSVTGVTSSLAVPGSTHSNSNCNNQASLSRSELEELQLLKYCRVRGDIAYDHASDVMVLTQNSYGKDEFCFSKWSIKESSVSRREIVFGSSNSFQLCLKVPKKRPCEENGGPGGSSTSQTHNSHISGGIQCHNGNAHSRGGPGPGPHHGGDRNGQLSHGSSAPNHNNYGGSSSSDSRNNFSNTEAGPTSSNSGKIGQSGQSSSMHSVNTNSSSNLNQVSGSSNSINTNSSSKQGQQSISSAGPSGSADSSSSNSKHFHSSNKGSSYYKGSSNFNEQGSNTNRHSSSTSNYNYNYNNSSNNSSSNSHSHRSYNNHHSSTNSNYLESPGPYSARNSNCNIPSWSSERHSNFYHRQNTANSTYTNSNSNTNHNQNMSRLNSGPGGGNLNSQMSTTSMHSCHSYTVGKFNQRNQSFGAYNNNNNNSSCSMSSSANNLDRQSTSHYDVNYSRGNTNNTYSSRAPYPNSSNRNGTNYSSNSLSYTGSGSKGSSHNIKGSGTGNGKSVSQSWTERGMSNLNSNYQSLPGSSSDNNYSGRMKGDSFTHGNAHQGYEDVNNNHCQNFRHSTTVSQCTNSNSTSKMSTCISNTGGACPEGILFSQLPSSEIRLHGLEPGGPGPPGVNYSNNSLHTSSGPGSTSNMSAANPDFTPYSNSHNGAATTTSHSHSSNTTTTNNCHNHNNPQLSLAQGPVYNMSLAASALSSTSLAASALTSTSSAPASAMQLVGDLSNQLQAQSSTETVTAVNNSVAQQQSGPGTTTMQLQIPSNLSVNNGSGNPGHGMSMPTAKHFSSTLGGSITVGGPGPGPDSTQVQQTSNTTSINLSMPTAEHHAAAQGLVQVAHQNVANCASSLQDQLSNQGYLTANLGPGPNGCADGTVNTAAMGDNGAEKGLSYWVNSIALSGAPGGRSLSIGGVGGIGFDSCFNLNYWEII